MGNSIIAKSFRPIGNSMGGVTRRAVSFTPAAAMTLRHWSFVAKRITNIAVAYVDESTLNDVDTIEWEIRLGSGAPNHRPLTTAESLLASGSFDFRYSSIWKLERIIEYTVNLTSPLQLEKDTEYFFILKMPNDEENAHRPLAWADTYNTGAVGEVDDTVYCCEYTTSGGWTNGDNTYNLQYTVLDEQAGVRWHVVIDGKGYMQPDKYRGYRCEQVASGLAQSRGGQAEHSQLRYPYSNLSQDDWTSGNGQIDMDDLHAFYYGGSLDTLVEGQAIIGPLVHRTGVETDYNEYAPSRITARYLLDPEHSTQTAAAVYYAQKFTSDVPYSASSVGVRVNKLPYQYRHNCYVCICIDSGGAPADVASGGLTGWLQIENVWRWDWRDITIDPPIAILTSPTYWVVVKTDAVWGRTPEHRVMFDADGSAPGGVAKVSTDGSSWTDLGQSLVFRINGGADGEMNGDVVAFDYGTVGGTDYLFCAAGKKVYRWDETNGVWIDISANIESFTGGGGNQTTADITDIKVFNGRLFVAQGFDNPLRQYNGSSWGPGTDTNVVQGGEFEDAEDLAEWTTNAATTLTSESGGHSGNCGKLLNTVDGSWSEIYQEWTVEVGKYYEVWLWHKNGDGTNVAHFKLGTPTDPGAYYFSSALNDPDWGQYHVLIGPTTETTLRLALINSNVLNASTYYDSVVMYEAPVAKYFHISKGYLWLNDDVNKVRHSNTGFQWSSQITVGDDLYEITDFIDYAGRLLVGKENGMWDIDDQDLARQYYLFPGQEHPDNCKGWAVWSGMLFIPMQGNSIWRWTGTNYKEVGPTDQRPGAGAEWESRIRALAATPNCLYALLEPKKTAAWGGIWAYNGLGWHRLTHHTATDQTAKAIFVTNEIGDEPRVWHAEGKRVDYIRLSSWTHNRYDDDAMDYDITGGSLMTSWWDGGLKDALKFWNRLTLLADIPDGCSIDVYYVKDGLDWKTCDDFVLLGTLRPEDLNDNGEYVLMFPDGLVAKSIQLIFRLVTTDSSKTPRIRAYNMESIVRQVPVDAYSFRVLLANNITRMDGTTETERTADDMWEELKRARAKNEPIVVSFPFKSIRCMISHLSEQTYQYKPDGMTEEVWERVANVSAIEAT